MTAKPDEADGPEMPPAAKSRSHDVIAGLEEQILTGQLAPGERLDERRIAQQFDVSRTPVREAIHSLVASGLAQPQGRRGAVVTRLSVTDLVDAMRVVAELEALAAAQAASRRSRPEERARLQSSQEACIRSAERGQVEAFNVANRQFHDAVVAASHNVTLRRQLRSVSLLTLYYRNRITLLPGRMTRSLPEHESVLKAILSGDPEQAAQHMRDHIRLLSDDVADLLHSLRVTGEEQILATSYA